MREEEGSIFFQAAAVSHLTTTADSFIPEDVIHKKNHSYWDFPSSSAVKNPPASAGDAGLTPRLGRSPGGGNSLVFWPGKIPWKEEPGRLQSIGLQRVGHD